MISNTEYKHHKQSIKPRIAVEDNVCGYSSSVALGLATLVSYSNTSKQPLVGFP